MYQSNPYDQYNRYYTTMNGSTDDYNSSQFRERSQTWGGNEVSYRTRVPQVSPSSQFTYCFDSLNSNEESLNSVHFANETPYMESDTISKVANMKKTSRKNPWGQETYADLIENAINSYPSKMATLQQIYDYISKNHKYFLDRSDAASSSGWKNSIRHNLSLHDKFLKCPKKNENMKSSLWSINLNSFKRNRSNSMDCKNSNAEFINKRRPAKEPKRSSANNSKRIQTELKRVESMRPLKMENITKVEKFARSPASNDEVKRERSPELPEIETEHKYLPPDLSHAAIVHKHEYSLHEDLGRLGMNKMEPIYNYNDQWLSCDNQDIPNFPKAAMEYSIFVADLFTDDI